MCYPSACIDFAAPKQNRTPFPFRQNHGICARYNQPGTFQVKNAAKTEARTMNQKAKTIEIKQMSETSKTKPKKEAKTEQNITVADKMPTAGQRAVHFRALAYALAIILTSPPPPSPSPSQHAAAAASIVQ